jgi:hypothetical protein
MKTAINLLLIAFFALLLYLLGASAFSHPRVFVAAVICGIAVMILWAAGSRNDWPPHRIAPAHLPIAEYKRHQKSSLPLPYE